MEIVAQFWSYGGEQEVYSGHFDGDGNHIPATEGSSFSVVNGRLEVKVEDHRCALGWVVVRINEVLFFVETSGHQFSNAFESSLTLSPLTLEVVQRKLAYSKCAHVSVEWATEETKQIYEQEEQALAPIIALLQT